MSWENVEVVKRLYAAFESGGLAAAAEYFHPDIVWEDLDALPDGGTYRGAEGITDAATPFYEAWDNLTLKPEELIDAGEKVVVRHRWRGTGRASGTPIDSLVWNVFTLRDGKITHRQGFQNQADALDSAGLPDEGLEQ